MENGVQLSKTQESDHRGGMRSSSLSRGEVLLRVVALALTLAAAVIVGVDKQTKIVPLTVLSTLPPLNVPLTAEWKDLSAFVFFVVANAIACSYAAISLLHPFINRGSRAGVASVAVAILDMLMTSLLFSSVGAAAAVGVIGYQGNSHVRWNKVCNVFDRFCNHVAVGLVLSMLAAVVFLLLVGRAVLGLRRR